MTKRKFPKKRRVVKKRGVTSSMKREVARQIARNVENKTVQSYIYSRQLFGPACSSSDFIANNMIALGPSAVGLVITQSAGQGGRVGNTIKTKSLQFTGTFVANAYNVSTNPAPRPVQVKMWILYDKSAPTTLPNPPTSADFFQNGAISKGFNDDLTDLWSPINKDRWRVLTTRSYKLGNSSYISNGSGYVPNQYFANNDFSLNANFRVNLTKFYPKMVKFNDSTTVPTTRGLYCMFTVHAADGGTIGGIDQQVNVQWMQSYVYEDA